MILVVGGGSIARRHIENLCAIGRHEIVACTGNASIAADFDIAVVHPLTKALEQKPQAVIIANITSQHIETAIAAAEQRCDLLIEKPLSHTMDGVGRLQLLRQQNDLVIMIACNLRWHPAVRAIKEAVDKGLLGNVLAVFAHCGSYLPDWRPARDYRTSYSASEAEGGGVILDLIHELDYLSWIFGEGEAIAAFAGKRSNLDIQTEDVADILVRFRGGLVAQIHLDYVDRVPSRGCRLVGETGTLIWEYQKREVRLLYPGQQEVILWSSPSAHDLDETYRAELRHFIHCIEARTVPEIPLEAGVTILRMALAAKQASREQRVVTAL